MVAFFEGLTLFAAQIGVLAAHKVPLVSRGLSVITRKASKSCLIGANKGQIRANMGQFEQIAWFFCVFVDRGLVTQEEP